METQDFENRHEPLAWLDCTLRDGGYYNDWDFSLPMVSKYLRAVADCGVTHVEVGFRTQDTTNYRGFSGYSPDSVLSELEIPPDLQLGVMVNTSELGSNPDGVELDLARLFPPSSRDFVSFVRLATHLEDLETASFAAKWLKLQGYSVAINLMQISEADETTLTAVSSGVNPEFVDVLYLADSLGVLEPEAMSKIITNFKSVWSSALGVHAHDNGGLALANTLAAMRAGAVWVDSTITGMGRGAGNTRTEILLGHLGGRFQQPRSIARLDSIIQDYFLPLQVEMGWGVNYNYVRAMKLAIHPTFVQELESNSSYSAIEMDALITELGQSGARRYNKEDSNLVSSWVASAESPQSDWNQKDLFGGRSVLLVGSGPSVGVHRLAIEKLAKQAELLVLSANLNTLTDSEINYGYIVCHPLRIASDADRYLEVEKPIIVPASLLPESTRDELKRRGDLRDLGVSFERGNPVAARRGIVTLPQPSVLGFGLLAALSGGAKQVYLAGFDGFQGDDPRRNAEQALIDGILGLGFQGEVSSITPTHQSLRSVSVYSLLSQWVNDVG